MPASDLPAPPHLDELDRPALFLDVDGTLLEFADHPDLVQAPGGLVSDLQSLEQKLNGALAILSGRTLSDLDRILGGYRPAAAGVHGAQLRTGGGQRVLQVDAESLDALADAVEARLGGDPNVLIERKPVAVAVHFRHVPERGAEIRRLLVDLALEHVGAFDVRPGVLVEEVRPAGTDKGQAMATLLAEEPFHGRTPVVVGDDLTDEDAFTEAVGRGGYAVLVGDRWPSAATHRLASPAQVRNWLAHAAAGVSP